MSSALLRTLGSQIADDDTAGVIKTATALLASSTSASSLDVSALHALVVALTHDAQYDEVRRLASDDSRGYKAAFASNASLAFILAYALYKAKDLDGCQALLRSPPLSTAATPHCAHLLAQALYKQGRFEQAVETYERHFSGAELSSDVELSANLLSALVSAWKVPRAVERVKEWKLETSSGSYELAYNAACVLIEAGDYPAALQLLQRAQRLAQATLKADGLSDSKVADETAVLRVQEAYCLQRMHQPEAALPLYTAVLQLHPSDSAVASVASNNVISLRSGEEKVFDSLKKSSRALQGPLDEERLTERQRCVLHFNRSLVLLSSKQLQPCHTQVQQMKKVRRAHAPCRLSPPLPTASTLHTACHSPYLAVLTCCAQDFPTSELPVLVEAALATAEKKAAEAEKVLEAHVASHPSQSVECQLALAHLALQRGDAQRARVLLEGLQGDAAYLQSLPSFSSALTAATLRDSASAPPLSQRPAVLAALVALTEQAGDEDAAAKAIGAAVDRWAVLAGAASCSPAVHSVYASFLDAASSWYMAHQRFPAAAQLIQRLGQGTTAPSKAGKAGSKAAPSAAMDDRALENIARLVLATAPVDAEVAQAQAALLPPLPAPKEAVEQLELKAAPEPGKRKAATAVADDGAAAGEAKRKAAPKAAPKKRKRKPLYPKGFDPANPKNPPPDPERWLPKWERTIVDKKGRRRKVVDGPMRGAQGGSSASAGSWTPGAATNPTTATGAANDASSSSPSPTSAASSSAVPTPMSPPSSDGVEHRADNARPSAAAAAAARKKKKGGKKMGF